jgi:hypothetical protein
MKTGWKIDDVRTFHHKTGGNKPDPTMTERAVETTQCWGR